MADDLSNKGIENRADLRYKEYLLEQLPYCLGAAYWAANNLLSLAQDISLRLDNEIKDNSIYLLSHDERDKMGFIVDNFLDSARRTQNALLYYIKFSISLNDLPKSLNKFIKKIDYWNRNMPSDLVGIIQNYWDNNGARLKDYRDLSQHYAVVASDARAFRADDEVKLFLVLPNNPEVKDVNKLRFTNPYVHALPYVIEELIALINLICLVTIQLEPKYKENDSPRLKFTFNPPINTDEIVSGRSIYSIEWLDQKISDILKKLYN